MSVTKEQLQKWINMLKEADNTTKWVVPNIPKEPGTTMEAYLMKELFEQWEGKK